MSLIRMEVASAKLHMQVPVTVILPQSAGPHKTLYLLHGASDDHSAWTRFTSIERYAAQHKLCVVMPSAHLSIYRDMVHGGAFFSYIADELPKIMRTFFHLSDQREDNFIAGLSMGGEGALRIGLLCPENYAAIGCFSAGLSNYTTGGEMPDSRKKIYHLAMGHRDPLKEFEQMKSHISEMVLSDKPLPRIFHCIGKDDFLLDAARATRDVFVSLPNDPFLYRYIEDEGAHHWDYWDSHIEQFLDFTEAQ